MTLHRPMFPPRAEKSAFPKAFHQIDRRGLLCAMAAVPASAAMPSSAPLASPATSPDPIFAAIEACRVAVVEFEKTVLALSELEAEERRIAKRRLKTMVGKVARNKAYDIKLAIEWDLIWTMPTTAAGLAALLRFCREMGSINELIVDDELEDVLEWTMECAACALAGLPKPPMSDRVAWNWANPYKASEEDVTARNVVLS